MPVLGELNDRSYELVVAEQEKLSKSVEVILLTSTSTEMSFAEKV